MEIYYSPQLRMRFIDSFQDQPKASKPKRKRGRKGPFYCQGCGACCAERDRWCHNCRPLSRTEEVQPNDEVQGIGNYWYQRAIQKWK